MTVQTLSVDIPGAGKYPIYIGKGALELLPSVLEGASSCAVVTNHSLARLYGEALAEKLGAAMISVPDGEQYKTLQTVSTLYTQFIDVGLDRRSVVIALGGGVIGDMAGFAAATYLRGVRFVQVPTSLLAMVDASVGSKVGVDIPQGKNLIGAFKDPLAVIIDPSVLATLPDVEWRCGVAEVIKKGLIRDPRLLESALYQRAQPDGGELAEDFIRRAVQIKVDVVTADPFEENIRAYLNLGHTFGHALENVSEYRVRHGEGVGIGLIAAARLSAKVGLCAPSLADQVEQLVQSVGLPTRLGHYDIEAIYAAMGTDKKRQGKAVRFVLLRSAGDPVLRADIPAETVIAVLDGLRG